MAHVPLLVLAPVLLVLAGCVLKSPPARNSRFSVDISQMVKADFYKDTWIFRHPTKRMTDYTEFIVAPVEVYGETPGIKRRERPIFEDFGVGLQVELRRLLGKDYFLVETPGPRVLRLEMKVVDIKPIVQREKDGRNVTVFGASELGSKLEVDAFDAVTNELVYSVSTLYEGAEYAAHEEDGRLENVERAFTEWSAYFKKRLDQAMKF